MRSLAIAAFVLAACQSREDRSPPAKAKDAAVAVMPIDAAEELADAPPKLDEEPPDPGKLIDEIGAIPAWQAVVDRAQFLSRRGQHGLVFGTLGEFVTTTIADAGVQPTRYTWLVDDTEGNGALAIKVDLGSHASTVKPGDRVALGGAWVLDLDRTYVWKVDELQKLPAAAASDLKDPPSPPGHAIREAPLPPGARTVSVARDNDIIYFMVVGRPPAIDGEGWPVGDALGTPVSALLNLPGERPSFGAQDFRTPEERWKLKRATVYWVRIGKVRRPNGPDKPAYINARTAPVKLM